MTSRGSRALLGFLIGFAIILSIALGMDAGATPPKSPTPTQPTSTNNASSSRSTAVGVGVGGSSRSNATGGAGGNSTANGGNSVAAVSGVSAHSGDATAHGGSATQSQTATGGSGGNSNQTQSANNAGNSQGVSVSSTYEDRLQAPNVFAPAVFASGPCAYGWSASLVGPGAGASFGKAKPDSSCDRRELARVLTPLNPTLALKILCADPIAAAVATGDDCVYAKPIAVVTRVEQVNGAPSAASGCAPDREVLSDAIDRAVKKCVSK